MLQAVEKARSGGDVAKALLFVERMLVEQGMMQPQWEHHFQAAWRKCLAKCNDSRQAILYLAAVQVPDPLPPHITAAELLSVIVLLYALARLVAQLHSMLH